MPRPDHGVGSVVAFSGRGAAGGSKAPEVLEEAEPTPWVPQVIPVLDARRKGCQPRELVRTTSDVNSPIPHRDVGIVGSLHQAMQAAWAVDSLAFATETVSHQSGEELRCDRDEDVCPRPCKYTLILLVLA